MNNAYFIAILILLLVFSKVSLTMFNLFLWPLIGRLRIGKELCSFAFSYLTGSEEFLFLEMFAIQ